MRAFTLKKKNEKHFLTFFILFIFFLAWSYCLVQFSPEEIITVIGIKNSYALVCIAGFLGGVSLFFPFPYYLLVATFGAAQMNPLLLGFYTGLGVILGESTSYFFGYAGSYIIENRPARFFRKFSTWVQDKSYPHVASALFVYGSIVPVPNDFILVPLGLGKYPYLKLMLPLGLGNMVFNTLIAFAVSSNPS